jgi:glycerol-3-phosphate dehydrogenase (NAD(P)+)
VVLLNTAKALDTETGSRLSHVCELELPGLDYTFAMLAGGTIAAYLFRHEPLGADVACEDAEVAEWLAELLSSDNLTVYPTTDLVGVEYASAFKNVVSILAGIINGMGYSYGSETHVITRAAHEIELIATKVYGARPETFSMHSQCWGNDLWMSCTGGTRNREFGVHLGKGMSVDATLKRMAGERKTVEGVQTLRTLTRLRSLTRYPLIDFLSRLVAGRAELSEIEQIIQGHRF